MIKVENLSKRYGEIQAVNNISFEVPAGKIAAIIGTSGCGKSTTLKMINRLEDPTLGSISINSENSLASDKIIWRRKIGYVTQNAGLLPHLTIKDNISLLSSVLKKPKKEINDRVKELMELVNLDYDTYKDKYPKHISGGQKQRVGIARALMEDPPIMLMDEPFGALDPITRNSIHEEFLSLNQKLHKTILMITHDMDEAIKLSDHLILMSKGEIIQQGTPSELQKNPANAFVANFMSNNL